MINLSHSLNLNLLFGRETENERIQEGGKEIRKEGTVMFYYDHDDDCSLNFLFC